MAASSCWKILFSNIGRYRSVRSYVPELSDNSLEKSHAVPIVSIDQRLTNGSTAYLLQEKL
jgi:hypothetical protein